MFGLQIQEPWLRYIELGIKRYEGRLNGGKWAQLDPGQLVVAFSDQREVVLKIVAHHKFEDFAEAWLAFGDALIPSQFQITSRDEANKLYEQYWDLSTIKENGVNIVEIEVVH